MFHPLSLECPHFCQAIEIYQGLWILVRLDGALFDENPGVLPPSPSEIYRLHPGRSGGGKRSELRETLRYHHEQSDGQCHSSGLRVTSSSDQLQCGPDPTGNDTHIFLFQVVSKVL